MTEDYKKLLLDYITELNPGTPTNAERINSIDETAWEEWYDEYLPTNWNNFRFKGAIKSQTGNKVIFYGGFVEAGGTYQSDSRGIILITDSELNPIQTIYQFSSGTNLRPIDCMIQEEDGQFVAVDSTALFVSDNTTSRQAFYNGQRRFIMLNDISQPTNNEYQVRLRTSYTFGSSYNNFICKDIFKNPTSSHYFMAGASIYSGNTSYTPRYVKIIDLKINVGSANEWGTSQNSTLYIYGGSYCYFDSSDNAQWKVLVSPFAPGDNSIACWYGTNASPTSVLTIFTPSYKTYIDEYYFECQSVFINENLVYFTTNNQKWGYSDNPDTKYVGLYEYNFSTNELKEIYLKNLGTYSWSSLDIIQLYAVNGELYIEYCTNVNTTNKTADYYVQRYEETWNPILVKETGKYIMDRRTFYVSQTFNLLKMYCIPTNPQSSNWTMLEITEIYNQSNYNGEPYTNYNSLIAKYGNIYSDNKLVFSRNLHNLSITNNYTMASIEVPNTYLNDINLNLKELVGETNGVLVENSQVITKNMYEVLYLNYINTINVKNENQGQNQDNLSNVENRINSNINVGTQQNYEATRISKVKCNYDASTGKESREFPIKWTSIDDTHKYTEFTIYIDDLMGSIELIGEEDNQQYIFITGEFTYQVGKYFTIKQYIKVE